MTDKQAEATLREAAAALGVDEEDLNYFADVDPFNDGNELEGALCRVEDHRYGALYLRRVNGKYKPQVVFCTPKIGYPFSPSPDGARVYRFPPVTKVAFYEKIDGTNILAYRYTDGRKTFVTYKTRLQPLLKASRWGDWGALWRMMLQKHPDIPTLPERNKAAVSFELYGSMNPHLVAYDVTLDVKVLFGVTDKGEIVPVSALDTGSVAPAKFEAEVHNQAELRATYERLREKMTALNRAHAHTGKFVTEGMVLYCHTLEGKVIPYKLKPEEIEEIHWAAGQGISKSIVQQACWKALENGYDLNVDSVRRILEEDWEARQVDVVIAAGFVNEVIADIERHIAFKAEVLERYRALGVSLRENKSAVMRALSPHFNKSDMQKVYAIIALEEGLAQ